MPSDDEFKPIDGTGESADEENNVEMYEDGEDEEEASKKTKKDRKDVNARRQTTAASGTPAASKRKAADITGAKDAHKYVFVQSFSHFTIYSRSATRSPSQKNYLAA